MKKNYDGKKVTPEMRELLRSTWPSSPENRMDPVRLARNQYALAAALAPQLRAGLFWGDITEDIFHTYDVPPGTSTEWPLDIVAPGTEKDYIGYTMPRVGAPPKRYVEADYIMIPTYPIGNSIDWAERFVRDAHWDVIARCMEVLEAGIVKKKNDDAWHLILAAALDRNVVVYDSDALSGQFSKRLITLMKGVMRRNGGGNSTSVNRSKLTDLYMSPEAIEDIRNWGLDQIDPFTQRQIFLQDDGTVERIFQVNLHDLDELGEGQEYQNFYLNDLAGALATGDVELVVGLDLETYDVFKNPVVESLHMEPDNTQHRARKMGYWAAAEMGYAILDSRPLILGSY